MVPNFHVLFKNFPPGSLLIIYDYCRIIYSSASILKAQSQLAISEKQYLIMLLLKTFIENVPDPYRAGAPRDHSVLTRCPFPGCPGWGASVLTP